MIILGFIRGKELTLEEKYRKLKTIIERQGSAAVAFSGGVDSSFLCYAAQDALGKNAMAVTIVSPMLPQTEIEFAKKIASFVGIKHILIEENDIDEVVASNPKDRCYYCKKIEFGNIIEAAKKNNIKVVLDGSNIDDLGDYRPGLKALSELKVISPLREVSFNKKEIRELSKHFNLPSWDKPAFACLASRIPYGEQIDREKLGRIEKAENYLGSKGFRQFRVRSHGGIARIEVAPDERHLFFNESLLDEISKAFKAFGFTYAAMELEGYFMGSLNRAL